MTRPTGRYAFPHTGAQEATRRDLFEQRLDPLTQRRVEPLGLAPGSRCLEMVSSGVLAADEARAMVARPHLPEFLGCGFAHIGVWGRRPS